MMFCLLATFSYSQTGNLTGSPYSLFGLGVESRSNTGINSAIGRTGIALKDSISLNLYNPSSFGNIDKDRVILDVGSYIELQNNTSHDGSEQRLASNFSNFTFGMNISQKSGIGLALIPETNVGYSLLGIETNIEGSNETFSTHIIGSGGINEVRLDYGYKLFEKLNIGASISYLFGTIEEDELILTDQSSLSISEDNYYKGYKFGIGLQYQFLDNYNFGAVMYFPTKVRGTRDRLVQQQSNFSILEETTQETISGFELPLELGFGTSTSFKNLLVSFDYTTKFWSATNQEDAIGTYVNQNIFGLGATYSINPQGLKYWERVSFRGGLNYNTGYLEIDDIVIEDYSATLGFGFPLGRQGKSVLHLAYSIGRRGTSDSFLVEENFNTLNINISLSNIWFQKRKYL